MLSLAKYTTISNTDFYLSYFDLSYVFPGHNVKRGLTVFINILLHNVLALMAPAALVETFWSALANPPNPHRLFNVFDRSFPLVLDNPSIMTQS